MPYAILAITEYYGPETRVEPVTDDRNQVILYRTKAAAQDAADNYNEPDPQYGCHVLGHNQASATDYVVRRIGWQRDMWYGAYVPSDYA